MADNPTWQCSFNIPWQYESRARALAMVGEYLKFAMTQSPLGFTLEEDSTSPTLLWVKIEGFAPTDSLNDVVLRVKKDIETMLGSFLITPKSVWDWVREDNFK